MSLHCQTASLYTKSQVWLPHSTKRVSCTTKKIQAAHTAHTHTAAAKETTTAAATAAEEVDDDEKKRKKEKRGSSTKIKRTKSAIYVIAMNHA